MGWRVGPPCFALTSARRAMVRTVASLALSAWMRSHALALRPLTWTMRSPRETSAPEARTALSSAMPWTYRAAPFSWWCSVSPRGRPLLDTVVSMSWARSKTRSKANESDNSVAIARSSFTPLALRMKSPSRICQADAALELCSRTGQGESFFTDRIRVAILGTASTVMPHFSSSDDRLNLAPNRQGAVGADGDGVFGGQRSTASTPGTSGEERTRLAKSRRSSYTPVSGGIAQHHHMHGPQAQPDGGSVGPKRARVSQPIGA
mmetsp:Transcript_72399/g.209591  ORF Transcript_72399/g.209591 Transcript_72399/m.209591 type:complete len:263 (+) Transcript_72399:146-934(+)